MLARRRQTVTPDPDRLIIAAGPDPP